ncbi:Endonuclease/Exonuclease/phosphatase family protein [Roseivivax jejudonensis]|uniref:Endonuclease/Exonuclease/phosphatase family protein n=1 Tax=Roseivivax jejudonensis TaxID=1529041 RepID=A0A1X6ZXP6_9RHOB|nr:endonuclease/exonuclease/phosphatase family protein [Roseivivax jejudonensis]SLN62828.1 Endonuclease/Exonuclease/phosphatase family protein [Roseivivax jejudonensis]
MTDPETRFTCASWNIHRARGNDGVVDPGRTADVVVGDVCAPPPDALLLQEADEEAPPHRGLLDLDRIERDTGLRSVHAAPETRWSVESHGFLGTIVFLSAASVVERVLLVDLPGHCHRGAVVVDFTHRDKPLRLVGAHLALALPLRVAQTRTIGQHLARRAARPTILCGDLNEWRPWGGPALSRRVTILPFAGPRRASFPARRPILPLDRVLVTPPLSVKTLEVLDTPAIRATSDHRPIRADLTLPAARS